MNDEIYQYLLTETAAGKISLEAAVELAKLLKEAESQSYQPIAIIGMAAQLPEARDVAEFWRNLRAGHESIRPIPGTRRLDLEAYLRFKGQDPEGARFLELGYLDRIDLFDYRFFGIAPKEAELMDPNQRLFLTTAWSAVEDAGYGGNKLAGSRTGVYLGFSGESPYLNFVRDVDPESTAVALPGNLASIIASRISYLLDLKGPGALIDTTCSSSLTAVHFACQGLRLGDCDLAIVGSVKLNLLPLATGYRLGIESSDGRTRAFDDGSDGTGGGEGAVAMVLKPLSAARHDQDHIYAVIKGSALNQDGSSVGITAPNPMAQADVIGRAWQKAGIDPETISYIEAHGTGTRLGDPVEIEGISQAFRRYTAKRQFCAISALKTNLGHLDHAAGMAGLLKAVLALQHRELPPSLHFIRPNRKINFGESPVYVNDRLRPWESEGRPRRCGVSAFGLSGTNCHLVLEEAPDLKISEYDKSRPLILTFSANRKAGLAILAGRYQKWLNNNPEASLAHVCYTANTGRGHYQYRMALVGRDEAGLRAKLESLRLTQSPDPDSGGGFAGGEPTGPGIYYGDILAVPDLKSCGVELSKTARRLICQFIESGKEKIELLEEIGLLYTRGAELDWEELYQGESHPKVSLPEYPFEPTRCWPKLPGPAPVAKSPQQDLFHRVGWKRRDLRPIALAPGSATNRALVFQKPGSGPRVRKLLTGLRETGYELVEVEYGREFRRVSPEKFQIGPDEGSYRQLLEAVWGQGLHRILHLAAFKEEGETDSLAALEESQEAGVLSLLRLVKALSQKRIPPGLEIIVCVAPVAGITGTEARLHPENAPLLGLGKVVGLENRHLKLRTLDLDPATPPAQIIAEINSGAAEVQVAYRKGQRYIPEFQPLNLSALRDDPIPIREGGVYIITGGSGGLGLAIARDLAIQKPVRLILIQRFGISSPGERELEGDPVARRLGQMRQKRQMEAIRELEALGATVKAYNVDLADEARLAETITGIRNQFGVIHGIIHCAGAPGEGFLARKTESALRQVLAPKVRGAWLLDYYTRPDNLDFMILFSSLTAVTGEPGQGDYTAANAYLDSFAAWRERRGSRTLSIAWTSWRDTGMAYDHGVSGDGTFFALPTSAALEAWRQVLRKPLTQVCIGAFNFQKADWIRALFRDRVELPDIVEAELAGRLNGGTENAAGLPVVRLTSRGLGEAVTGTEFRLAQVWGQTLGLNEIDRDDDFFSLGGNSLLLIKLETDLEKSGFRVTAQDLSLYSTIRKLASFLEGVPPEGQPLIDAQTAYSVIDQSQGGAAASKSREAAAVGRDGVMAPPCGQKDLPVVKILPEVEPFNEIFYQGCFYNSFFPVARHFHKEILGFLVNDLVVYSTDGALEGIGVKYIAVETFEELVAKAGIEMAGKFSSPDLIGDLCASLGRDRLVIIWVDCFYEPLRNDLYQKKHWPHTWLVYGYDRTQSRFHIIEHRYQDNLAYNKEAISFRDALNAYQGFLANFPPTAPTYLEFGLPSRAPDGGTGEEPDLSRYRGTLLANTSRQGDLILKGLDILFHFQAGFAGIINSPSRLREITPELVKGLNEIINAKQAEKYRVKRLWPGHPELAPTLEAIVALWKSFRMPLAKYMYSEIYDPKLIHPLPEKLGEICRLEERVFEILVGMAEG
ncbi:MAG: SDR family oxidoreductase [Firmicutes bacterium]|nr:SDR family oxidoreductase [Bacillota bacterium]